MWKFKYWGSRLRSARALVSLLYCGELRVSEALRLVKSQFSKEKDCIKIKNVLLSKRHPGALEYREVRLPLKGERSPFTELITTYLDQIAPEDRLFPWSLEVRKYHTKKFYKTRKGETKERLSHKMIGTSRAWWTVKSLLPDYTEHWLRLFGESYLYRVRDHDILAVADEVKVDARTLQGYLRSEHEKWPAA